jgi:hypothetical protein
MAKVAAPAGSVIEETKRTRVLPGNSPDADGDKPWRLLDTWEYLASLAPEQWTREDITVYLYRYDEKGSRWGIGKYTTAIDEFKVMEMFGGGRFNLVVKRRQQIIKNEDFQLEGPAKTPGVNGAPPLAPGTTAPASGESAMLMALTALIEELKAARGGTVLQDSIRNAIALNQSVFSAAMPAVTKTLESVTGGGNNPARDPIMDKLLTAAIERMMNPPAANSLKDTMEMIALLKGSGLLGVGDSKTSMALELVRQVPNVAQTLVQGVEHWRFAEEARARQAAIMRTGPQPINVPPNAPPPVPQGNVIPMPPPAPAAQPENPPPPTNTQADAAAVAAQVQVPQKTMPIEALEQLVCDIIMDPNLSIEQAAIEAAALIERVLPGQTDKMAAAGRENLLFFFRDRPVLAQVANHPKLPEFLDKFIETVKAAPVMQAPNPTAPVA